MRALLGMAGHLYCCAAMWGAVDRSDASTPDELALAQIRECSLVGGMEWLWMQCYSTGCINTNPMLSVMVLEAWDSSAAVATAQMRYAPALTMHCP